MGALRLRGARASPELALARSILHDAVGTSEVADALCGRFAHEVVATLPGPEFVLARDCVIAWLFRNNGIPTAAAPARTRASNPKT